jgi:Rrf2 family protein
MISKKAKYALKALIYLGHAYLEKSPKLISDIANSENIPKKFLENILLELKKEGILLSVKGRGGGYLLRIDPRDINLARIIRTIDGPIAPVLCVSLHFYGKCDDCQSEEICRLRPFMEKIRDANLAVYENNSLFELLNQN